jgi:hypothetical protein
MINLAPKQTQNEELPEPVGSLVLNNETIALIDLEVELEDKILKITVKGLHIGSPQETPFEPKKKKWNLS